MKRGPRLGNSTKSVVVLCSGFGLGFYIPGIVISEGLRKRGLQTEVLVFENLLRTEKVAMVERNRAAYHASFRVALASQKVPIDIRESLDERTLEGLLDRWAAEGRRHFISLSGHWVTVLDAYRRRLGAEPIYADLLYVDADLSPSWRHIAKLRPDYAAPYREVRLYDSERRDISYGITVGSSPPVHYGARERRLVVHGGGWGIGTFQDSATILQRAGFGLDVVCYAPAEEPPVFEGNRYFMDDPGWRCWHHDERGEHTFPPFGMINGDGAPTMFEAQRGNHGLYDIIRASCAIVSKPGAGTLIDSFSSATPLIMLEPFGLNEERNTAIWESCGFGVKFAKWAAAGFPKSMLDELHDNLLRRKNERGDTPPAKPRDEVKDYISEYVQYFAGTPAECAA